MCCMIPIVCGLFLIRPWEAPNMSAYLTNNCKCAIKSMEIGLLSSNISQYMLKDYLIQ